MLDAVEEKTVRVPGVNPLIKLPGGKRKFSPVDQRSGIAGIIKGVDFF